MNRSMFIGVAVLLALGCASNPQSRLEIAQQEAARMPAPNESLANFSRFELASVELAPAVQEDEKKVRQAEAFAARLAARLQPLLDDWNANGSGAGRVLVIRPTVQQLRIVSGGARFWVGAMAGESSVDVDLMLVEKSSGQRVGQARVQRGAGAMAGGWSVGATDRNLIDYVVDICHEYLVRNHGDPS